MPSGNTIPADVATVDPGVTVPFPGNVSVAGTLAVTGAASTGALTPSSLAVSGASTLTGAALLSALATMTVGFRIAAVAAIATATGATTGTIADTGSLVFVTVSVTTDANDIIILPAPTPGTIVILCNGATGYELRTSAPATISINGGTGSAGESAIAASTMVIAYCKSATAWAAIGLAGTTLAAVEAAAN